MSPGTTNESGAGGHLLRVPEVTSVDCHLVCVPVTRYITLMEQPIGWRRFLTPLNFAAYVAWFGVLLATWQMHSGATDRFGLPLRAVAVGMLLLFLAGFLIATTCVARRAMTQTYVGLTVMTAAILALLLTGPVETTPVLLVVFASVITPAIELRAAMGWLISLNGALFAVLLSRQSVDNALFIFAIYGGFQLFAAIASLAMRRANESAAAVRQVNAHLLATQSLLAESARDGERLRLSRELHDISGHKLTAIKLNLALLQRDPALARLPELATVSGLANELLSDLRGVVSQLRRHDGIDMKEALTRLVEVFPAPHLHLQVDEVSRIDDAERAESIVRVAQESLTNAVRHAGARNVWLKLQRAGESLELTIEDDGRSPQDLKAGHGLVGMRERVEALGGTLELAAGAAGGLRVFARVPRERPS